MSDTAANKLGLAGFTDLLADAGAAVQVAQLPVGELHENPLQERRPFNPSANEADAELVASVREHGIIEPITVVPRDEGGYTIISGHRRTGAGTAAGLPTVPCIVSTLSDIDAALQVAITNVQREDLTPLEEGRQYVRLMNLFNLSARQLAKRLAKSDRTVQRRVELTELPVDVQSLMESDSISAHVARGCKDEQWGGTLASLAAAEDLSRGDVDVMVAYLTDHPEAGAEEAFSYLRAQVQKNLLDKARDESAQPKPVQPLDYEEIVAGLHLPLSPDQAATLVEMARAQQLADYAVRWAALICLGSDQMTVAGAVVYARQVSEVAIGRFLRGAAKAVTSLEERVQKPDQLTANMATAAGYVIEDLVLRLRAVSGELDTATGLVAPAAKTVDGLSDI